LITRQSIGEPATAKRRRNCVRARTKRGGGDRRSAEAAAFAGSSDTAPGFMAGGDAETIRGDDAIAAGRLGLVQRNIGPPQQPVYGVSALPFRNAEAAGDPERAVASEMQRCDRPSEILRDVDRIEEVALTEHAELFSAETRDKTVDRFCPGRDIGDDDVAALVSVVVVDLLEVIDVEDNRRHDLPRLDAFA